MFSLDLFAVPVTENISLLAKIKRWSFGGCDFDTLLSRQDETYIPMVFYDAEDAETLQQSLDNFVAAIHHRIEMSDDPDGDCNDKAIQELLGRPTT